MSVLRFYVAAAPANVRALTPAYPKSAAERDRWILARRPPRHAVDPRKPFAFLLEEERDESGEIVKVATIFLTNRECPWRCLMCDLWKNTLTETVPVGAIPEQIDYALAELSEQGNAGLQPASSGDIPVASANGQQPSRPDLRARTPAPRQIKLYNSGSFFDPRAIPTEDYPAIAERVSGIERVIVECHPALVGERCLQFREMLDSSGGQRRAATAKLEVAMGLESAHPEVLEKLNKRMTIGDFERAADFLRAHDIALRAFVLVKPPFLDEDEALEWVVRSVEFAFGCGATAVSLIPTRPSNGAMDRLMEAGEFTPPRISTLERALEITLNLHRGRVFADTWDLEQFSSCPGCLEMRRQRLRTINLTQEHLPTVDCPVCQGS